MASAALLARMAALTVVPVGGDEEITVGTLGKVVDALRPEV